MSNIVILVGSVRKDGNTDTLAKSFAKGAVKNNNVEIIYVADYDVNPCIGCDTCFTREGKVCFQQDDMLVIFNKLLNADVLVIASPVYFYGLSAQLKTIIDRLHMPARSNLKVKKMGLLLVAAVTSPEVFNSILVQYKLVTNRFKLDDIGKVFVTGVREYGKIEGNPGLKEAFNLGESIE